MREADFLKRAYARIERAKNEEDCMTLSQYLVENYPASVRERACEALGELSSEESVGCLMTALFEKNGQKEFKAMIIQTLSAILTRDDLPSYISSYDLKNDPENRRLYYVLDYCLRGG